MPGKVRASLPDKRLAQLMMLPESTTLVAIYAWLDISSLLTQWLCSVSNDAVRIPTLSDSRCAAAVVLEMLVRQSCEATVHSRDRLSLCGVSSQRRDEVRCLAVE